MFCPWRPCKDDPSWAQVKSIIEEFQMQALGGMEAASELWERALVPSLISGAGTWFGESKKTVELCDDLQNFFWRVMLKVPESCPKLALLCEPKMTDFKWRIYEEKCMLLLQIKCLEEGSLAKIIYEEAELNSWPGLGKDVRQICLDIGIPDLNCNIMTKQDIKKAIQHSHYEHMMQLFEGSSKLHDIKEDDFRSMQLYFNDKNLESARTKFKIRTKMLEQIPGNCKNLYKN